jgi:hypothetical protein
MVHFLLWEIDVFITLNLKVQYLVLLDKKKLIRHTIWSILVCSVFWASFHYTYLHVDTHAISLSLIQYTRCMCPVRHPVLQHVTPHVYSQYSIQTLVFILVFFFLFVKKISRAHRVRVLLPVCKRDTHTYSVDRLWTAWKLLVASWVISKPRLGAL